MAIISSVAQQCELINELDATYYGNKKFAIFRSLQLKFWNLRESTLRNRRDLHDAEDRVEIGQPVLEKILTAAQYQPPSYCEFQIANVLRQIGR